MMTRVMGKCWNCQAPISIGEVFCKGCSRIQPFAEGTDYFAVMKVGRLLQLDLQALERRFYELSRQLHPDFHHGKDETEKNISLENSAILNQAYRTLKDPFSRVEYLIRLEEGGKGEITAKIPQEFLEKIFELQETLEQHRSSSESGAKKAVEEKLRHALKVLKGKLSDLEKSLFDLFNRWDQAVMTSDGTAGDQKRRSLIQQMKENLSYRTYFKNLIGDIEHLLKGNAQRREVRH